jgi:hypothetical protein
LAQTNPLHGIVCPIIRPYLLAHKLINTASDDVCAWRQFSRDIFVYESNSLLHALERRRDEAGKPHDMGLEFMDRCEEFTWWDIHAEVMYGKPMSAHQDLEDVLSDEVNISLGRAQDDAASVSIPNLAFGFKLFSL